MDIREQLSKIRCFLLDMDGTFYLGNQLIDGSLDFLDALRRTGRQCLFLTNNSSKSAAFYQNKLKNMGVPEEFRNVLTSGQAAARYVTHRFPDGKAFLLANAIETEELQSLGVTVDQEHPDYVLIAFDTELDYRKMTLLCDHVRAGLPYIATHPDFNCPTETGFIPDIGATIAYVKASTGREPDIVIGKPNSGIVEETLRVTGLRKEEMAMVGDRLYTDIATGVNFGMLSILVMSGETTAQMAAESPIKPGLTFGRLSDMIAFL
jgi:HAD superfamily hydrolase (TIGR01457 family)